MSLTPLVPISDLMPYIQPHVSTCPDFVAEFHARQAIIEFCERTRCWRHIATRPVPDSGKVRVFAHAATIYEIEEATFDGQALQPTQFTETDPSELSGNENLGFPGHITQINPGEVMLIPRQAGTLRISCFLKPQHGQQIGTNAEDPLADALNYFPQFMLEQHAEALACGALFRIMSVPKQDFTDKEMAPVHLNRFNNACDNKFSSNIRGQQRTPLRTKPNFM